MEKATGALEHAETGTDMRPAKLQKLQHRIFPACAGPSAEATGMNLYGNGLLLVGYHGIEPHRGSKVENANSANRKQARLLPVFEVYLTNNVMQWDAMQCDASYAMQFSAMQCNAMQCDAMQCNALQCNAMQRNAM